MSKMLRFHLFECYFWHAVIWRYWGGSARRIWRENRASQKYCKTLQILIISPNPSRSNEQSVKIALVLTVFLTCGDSAFLGGIGEANLERKPELKEVLQNLANIDIFPQIRPLKGATCEDSICFCSISDTRQFANNEQMYLV